MKTQLQPSELVVLFKKGVDVSVEKTNKFTSQQMKTTEISNINTLLGKYKTKLTPLFGDRLKTVKVPGSAQKIYDDLQLDPSSFFTITAENPNELESIQQGLLKEENVEAAYLKPPAADPDSADWVTPDFTASQGYLDQAPNGIDAKFAWRMSGGRGEGIEIIDMEQGFNLDHRDLPAKFGGLIQGNNRVSSFNHGTAVLGVLGGDDNERGVTGISHNSQLRAISYSGSSTSQTIIDAADELNAGDLLLLEVHRPGPAARDDAGQDGFIAIEWWPDDFAAIVYATSKGIIVVEAAGNGAEDLDAEIYNEPESGFPAGWKNPFNLNNPQSGAVIVGAGSPWSSTDRTILSFSNWGSRVDSQGWGQGVATTGYGGLQGDQILTVDPFDDWSPDANSPSTGTSVFSGFNLTNVTAALWSDTNQKIYLFKKPQRKDPAKYTRIDAATMTVDPDYPKPIEDNWPGLPDSFNAGIDAALWNERSTKIYFFKDSEYVRIDPNDGWNVEPGYPKPINGNWPGLPAHFTNKLDAAVWNDKNDKVYIFKDSEYVRLDPNNGWNVDPGYPKPIQGNWPGFPVAFTESVDTAVYSKLTKKLYVFKAEDILYTSGFSGTSSASPVVTGALACIQSRLKLRGNNLLTPSTAQNILRNTGTPQLRFSGDLETDEKSNWRGVNASFGSGIDTALWNGKSDKVYFFRGSQFVRIDPAVDWNVEPEYPKPIEGNWPGFPEDFLSNLDAAIWSEPNQKVYFFKGSEYIRIDPFNGWNVDPDYPKPIEGNWPGFPNHFTSDLDAAIWNGKNDKIYFFKANEYIRVDPANEWNVDSGYPKTIDGNWPVLNSDFESNLDAALWSGTNGKIYFFKGESYVRIDPDNNWYMDYGYPKVIARQRIGKRPDLKMAFEALGIDSNWPGFPSHFGSDLDAGVWTKKNDKVYFFKGSEYVRVDPENNWEVDSGYPKAISGNWPGFPAHFASGVDAAVWNDKSDKVYFFKGSEYIRVDPNNNWNVEPGYPKPIEGNWPGFPAHFATGVEAGIWTDKNNKVYFFKGDEYIRVDPFNGWNVDPGYPKPIENNWPGLQTPFTNGLDAALWNDKSDKVYFFKGGEYVRIDPDNNWNVDSYYPRPIIS